MNKKKNVKLIISSLLTVLIVISVLIPGGVILEHKLSYGQFLDRANNKEFYKLEENTIDVLCIGSSQIMTGFSAPRLYEKYGITAFGLAGCWQNMHGAYHWLLESQKYQQPELVILEVSSLYGLISESSYIRSYTEMKNTSKVKWDALRSLDLTAEEILGYYSPVYKYHDRFNELTKADYSFLTGAYRKTFGGFAMSKKIFEEEPLSEDMYILNTNAEKQPLAELNEEYFIKFVEYCKQNGIDLLLYKTTKEDWSDEDYATVKSFADEYSLPYIDMNTREVLSELKLDFSNDMLDPDHLNKYGAYKATDYLGEYISENYSLTDHRTEDVIESYEEMYQRYKTELEEYMNS